MRCLIESLNTRQQEATLQPVSFLWLAAHIIMSVKTLYHDPFSHLKLFFSFLQNYTKEPFLQTNPLQVCFFLKPGYYAKAALVT